MNHHIETKLDREIELLLQTGSLAWICKRRREFGFDLSSVPLCKGVHHLRQFFFWRPQRWANDDNQARFRRWRQRAGCRPVRATG